MIEDENVCDPTSVVGRKFRRRFRVSFERFRWLVAQARSWKRECGIKPLFADRRNTYDKKTIPLEIKILGVLRYLGSGESPLGHSSLLLFHGPLLLRQGTSL